MEIFFLMNLILSILIVFFQRKNPATVWAWLLLIYFLPVAGFVLYLIFGRDFHKEKMFRAKEIEGEMKYAARRQKELIRQNKICLEDERMGQFEKLILYNLHEESAVLTDNNHVEIYYGGQEKFTALLHEIEMAETYIHLEYYIIHRGELWNKLKDALIRKAHQGVEVRILIDGIGCRNMSRGEWRKLREQKIAVEEFFPALFGKLHLRMNYRNHRKIAVIDGRVGFMGGMNIGQEYLGENKKFGNWRDVHLRLEGSAVTSLAVRFTLDWNYAARENLFLKEKLFQIPRYETKGNEPVQIISSGPDSQTPKIQNNYLKLIHMAQKNIYIQTPYFIPDDSIREALKIAVKSGVQVNIMIPCKPDHPFVYWATYSYVGELVEAGAYCYIYEDGFLHAKSVCVDGSCCCLGTANMDIRSFSLNFEVNAVIYSKNIANQMEEQFKTDIRKSRQLTKELYDARNWRIRVKEQTSRLLSPIL